MGSINFGKAEIIIWILDKAPENSHVLDVGACDGKWYGLLSKWYVMDACEIFEQNIIMNQLTALYRTVYHGDINDFKYDHYDVVIFGDVIEHMEVKDAQAALKYAKKHSDLIVVGVPFHWPQGECYGNKWERHIQEDLTHELFMKRYPGFDLFMKQENYGWYVWEKNATKCD